MYATIRRYEAIDQTRVEAEIHTPYEVVAGAVIGTLVTLILFQVFR